MFLYSSHATRFNTGDMRWSANRFKNSRWIFKTFLPIAVIPLWKSITHLNHPGDWLKSRKRRIFCNFHIKKQFYSFKFCCSSFDMLFRFFFVCFVWNDFKNVLIKAEIEKTEIKLILLFWDFYHLLFCYCFAFVFRFREANDKEWDEISNSFEINREGETWDRKDKRITNTKPESRLRTLFSSSFCYRTNKNIKRN